MDEFAFFCIGFAAIAWGVGRLIDAGVGLWITHINYKDTH